MSAIETSSARGAGGHAVEVTERAVHTVQTFRTAISESRAPSKRPKVPAEGVGRPRAPSRAENRRGVRRATGQVREVPRAAAAVKTSDAAPVTEDAREEPAKVLDMDADEGVGPTVGPPSRPFVHGGVETVRRGFSSAVGGPAPDTDPAVPGDAAGGAALQVAALEQRSRSAHPGFLLAPSSGCPRPAPGEIPDGATVASSETTVETVAVVARVAARLDATEEVQVHVVRVPAA